MLEVAIPRPLAHTWPFSWAVHHCQPESFCTAACVTAPAGICAALEGPFDCESPPDDDEPGSDGVVVEVCGDCTGVCAGSGELPAAFPPQPSVDTSSNAGAQKYTTGCTAAIERHDLDLLNKN